MKCFEINDKVTPDGRRRFKASLHEIYPDETCSNKNGICYLEEFTKANMQTAIEMPICCEFADPDKRAPLGHGFTGQRTRDGLALFEDSVVVGCVDRVWIDDIAVNDRTAKVLMSEGVLYEQRYPELIDWMRNKMDAGMDVQGSVEFVGTEQNGGIIKYLNDYDGEGRIPVEYVYSGFCLLSVPPADEAAIVVELNQQESENKMDEQTRKEICEVVSEAIALATANREAVDAELNTAKRKIEECEQTISELNARISEYEAQINQRAQELETANGTLVVVRNELNERKIADAKARLTSLLAEFTEEQRNVAQAEINAFNENPLDRMDDIEAIANKVAAGAYRQMQQKKDTTPQMNQWDMSGILAGIDPVTAPEPNVSGYDFDPECDFV